MGRFLFFSLGLLAVVLSLSGAEGYRCPVDWLSKDELCYKLFSEPKTWLDAEMFCRKYKPGCHLTSLHSNADSADLAEYVTDYLKTDENVWIGLSDPQKNGIWKWSDRSFNNYLSWNEGEPNNSNQNEYCVHLWYPAGFLKWNDAPCENSYPFLCQCRF